MTGKLRPLVLAVAAAVALTGCGSGLGGPVGGFLRDTYERSGTDNGGEIFQSSVPVAATADQIAGRHRPVDRVRQAGQEFLRYDDAIVGVVPSGGGSRIVLDDRDRGYTRWAAFVGPTWRPIGDGGISSRGGGSGFGK